MVTDDSVACIVGDGEVETGHAGSRGMEMGRFVTIGKNGGAVMSDWIWFIAAFAAYIVLMRWVLPRLGVPT